MSVDRRQIVDRLTRISGTLNGLVRGRSALIVDRLVLGNDYHVTMTPMGFAR